MTFFYDKLKAIAAALAGAGLYYVKEKFGIDLGLEAEAAIAGFIMGLVTYLVPNLKPSGAVVKQG